MPHPLSPALVCLAVLSQAPVMAVGSTPPDSTTQRPGIAASSKAKQASGPKKSTPKHSAPSNSPDRILANGDGSSSVDHRIQAPTDSVDPRNANIVGISRGSGKKSPIASLLQDREAPKARLVPVVASDIQLSGAKGLRTQDEILVILRQHTGWFAHLYRDQQRDNPSLAGTMTIQFQIQANGTVTGQSVASSTTGDEVLDQEILSGIRRMRFAPIPTSTVAVQLPLTFEPVKPRD